MKFLIFALLPVFLYGQLLTKFQWNDCGSPAVDFNEIDVTPMPIVHPGTVNLTFISNIKRQISGSLNTKLSIKRTVYGITLPITW